MAKKEQKENNKNKKSFFKDFKVELKKVTWPTPKQLVNNTVAVITIVLITSIIVFALDLVFETINKQGIERLKQMVSQNETTENATNENNETPETIILDENSTNESGEGEATETQTPENATTDNAASESTNPENTTSEEATSNE